MKSGVIDVEKAAQIIIDNDFKVLLPALDSETYRMLEENIIQNGCRDAIIVWEGILIDGHNRYEICTKNDIPFTIVEKEFESREEVLIWIVSNQISRRNLTSIQLSHFRGIHYRAVRKIQGTRNQFVGKSENRQNDGFKGVTAEQLASQYRVSTKTIERDNNISQAIDAIGKISPEAQRKILSGEVAVDKKELEKLMQKPLVEIEEIAAEIEDGTYDRVARRKAAASAASALDKHADDSIPEEMRGISSAISSITDSFYSQLWEHMKNVDLEEVKSAIRSYITLLEELYREISSK